MKLRKVGRAGQAEPSHLRDSVTRTVDPTWRPFNPNNRELTLLALG
ncbi:MAG TPA: hypothetical protein VMZ30_19130 [Pyrinomonadaceae bacterium]|nr:hypothetical protein [Pyrinomonadaceae bacterium]